MDRMKVPLMEELKTGLTSYLFHSVKDLRDSIEGGAKEIVSTRNGILFYSRYPTLIKLVPITNEDFVDEQGESQRKLEVDLYENNITLEDELQRQLILYPVNSEDPKRRLIINCDVEGFLEDIESPRYPSYNTAQFIDQMLSVEGLVLNPVIHFDPKSLTLNLVGHHYDEEITIPGENGFTFVSRGL